MMNTKRPSEAASTRPCLDRVVIRTAAIKRCGSCAHGRKRDLQDMEVMKGWVWCTVWNFLKPMTGLCDFWS